MKKPFLLEKEYEDWMWNVFRKVKYEIKTMIVGLNLRRGNGKKVH